MEPYRPPHLRRQALAESAHDPAANVEVVPSDVQRASRAISEGRRVYVGNMPYLAKEEDVRNFFGGWPVENISMSIDPFTGRNPSYAFVDLGTPEDAERAIAKLSGRKLLGRPLRIRPGVAPRSVHPVTPPRPFSKPSINKLPGRGRVWDRWQKSEANAVAHWNYATSRMRLYVGNLPCFNLEPVRVDAEIKHFFDGFHVEAISKIIPPKLPGVDNGYYVFVDFPTTDEAARAVRMLNGARSWGRGIKVEFAEQEHSWKTEERERYQKQFGDN